MSKIIESEFPTFARMMRLFCHANSYDIAGLKDQINREQWREINPSFKDDFDKIIKDRLISTEEFESITDIELSTDELYANLREIFETVYDK